MNFKKNAVCSAVLFALPVIFSHVALADSFSDFVGHAGGTKTDVEFSKYVEDVATSSPELSSLLATATDEASALKLINEINPDADGAAIDAALASLDMMRASVSQRANTLRKQSAQGNYNFGWNTWISPLLSVAKKSESDGVNGYDANTFGLMMGADNFILEDEAFIGYALGYTHTDSDVENSSKDITVDNGEFIVYAGWIKDDYFANANFNSGLSNVNTERTIGADTSYTGDTKAEAKYKQYQMGYALNVGSKYDAGIMVIEPSVGYSRQWLYQEDYEESGSVASLRFDRETYDLQYAKVGLALYNTYDYSWGSITPRFMVNYAKDLYPNQRVKETVQLAIDNAKDKDSFYTVLGNKVGGDVISSSLSASIALTNTMSIDAALSYTNREDYNAFGGDLNFVKRF